MEAKVIADMTPDVLRKEWDRSRWLSIYTSGVTALGMAIILITERIFGTLLHGGWEHYGTLLFRIGRRLNRLILSHTVWVISLPKPVLLRGTLLAMLSGTRKTPYID